MKTRRLAAAASATEVVRKHYAQEAREHKLSPTSTMADVTTREFETRAVLEIVDRLAGSGAASLLEIGCGNGHLLSCLRKGFGKLRLHGLDCSPEMVRLARSRRIPGCRIVRGSADDLGHESGTFDLVVGERCLINILDVKRQRRALEEIRRVLRPGGHYVCIEAFLDGLGQLNEARGELGLGENAVPHHNRWFREREFRAMIAGRFEEVRLDGGAAGPRLSTNFLSSYYFVSRVLYPAITRAPLRYNTHFVRFFKNLPPAGDYSPIRLYLLRRPVGGRA